MLRLLIAGAIGAALAYYLDPAAGRRRREGALARLDAETLSARVEVDRIKERVHENWSAVTDEEIERAKGNLDELIGTIRAKTGETVESIREQLYGPRRTESGVSAR